MGESGWWSHSTTPPQNPMTHNTKGENPLDAPNIEEETNAFPSNGYGLYINKRTLNHLHTLVVVWCLEFGT
jgi:hypothetical protein